MSWTDKVIEEAKKRIAEEDQLLKETYSGEFAEYAKNTGLYFSFGDIKHLIDMGLTDRILIREKGGAAGIAYFEDLVKRFKLYLIAELRVVLLNEPPYSQHRDGVNYGFILDFLEVFKQLDRARDQLKEIRAREGGNYA